MQIGESPSRSMATGALPPPRRGSSPVSRLRVIAQDEPAVVVGTLIQQPPRITLASDATKEFVSSERSMP